MFNLICNPQGGTTKRFSTKVRDIDDLSAPYDGSGKSVNEGIRKEGITHTTIDKFIAAVQRLGRHTVIWKCDVTSAYKLITVRLHDLHLLGSHMPDGFWFSLVLAFGYTSSGDIWDEYGMVTEFAGRLFARPDILGRYADDFGGLTAPRGTSPDWTRAMASMLAFMHVCDVLGVPMAKFEIGTRVEMLGIIIDTELMRVEISTEKRTRVIAELQSWLAMSSCSRKELERLAGYLNFLCVVVPNGRAFLGRIISLLHVSSLSNGSIAVPESCRLDIQFWHDVLSDPDWQGHARFLDSRWTTASELMLLTDAEPKGHGAFFDGHWYGVEWSPADLAIVKNTRLCSCDKHQRNGVSMPFLEALAYAYAAATWGPRWSGKKIVFYSDCKPAIDAVNKRYSPSPALLYVIRSLILLAHRYNFVFRFDWLSTNRNAIADALSRRNFTRFHFLCDDQGICADSSPTKVSPLPLERYESVLSQ